jgi:hypothetical protein
MPCDYDIKYHKKWMAWYLCQFFLLHKIWHEIYVLCIPTLSVSIYIYINSQVTKFGVADKNFTSGFGPATGRQFGKLYSVVLLSSPLSFLIFHALTFKHYHTITIRCRLENRELLSLQILCTRLTAHIWWWLLLHAGMLIYVLQVCLAVFSIWSLNLVNRLELTYCHGVED